MNQNTIDKILRGLGIGANIKLIGDYTPNEFELAANLIEFCSNAQIELNQIWQSSPVHQDRIARQEISLKTRIANEQAKLAKQVAYLKEVDYNKEITSDYAKLVDELEPKPGLFANLDDVLFDDAPKRKTPKPKRVAVPKEINPPHGTFGEWDYPNLLWTKQPTEADAAEICKQKVQRDSKSKLWNDVEATKKWLEERAIRLAQDK